RQDRSERARAGQRRNRSAVLVTGERLKLYPQTGFETAWLLPCRRLSESGADAIRSNLLIRLAGVVKVWIGNHEKTSSVRIGDRAYARIAVDRNGRLGVEHVKDCSDESELCRSDGEVFLHLKIGLRIVRQPARPTRLDEERAVRRSRAEDGPRCSIIPVILSADDEVERQM